MNAGDPKLRITYFLLSIASTIQCGTQISEESFDYWEKCYILLDKLYRRKMCFTFPGEYVLEEKTLQLKFKGYMRTAMN